MRRLDPAFFWMMGYFTTYLVLLKILPITMGALTLALLFALIIDVIAGSVSRFTRLGRTPSIILSSFLFLGLMGFSIYSVFPILFREGRKILDFMINMTEKPINEIFPNLESGSQALKFAEDVMDWLGDMFVRGFEQVGTMVLSKIPDVATGTVLLIIASTYIALVLPRFKNFVSYMFPRSTLNRTENFLRTFYTNMKRFVGGQMINALIVGTIVWVGLWSFGIKYSGFFGILAGITDFIPFLGAFITAVPSAFVGLSQKGIPGLIQVGLILTVANQLEGWVLAPKILGNQVKLNWFLVLVSIIALSEVYGFLGIFISIPVLIAVREIWRYYVTDILRKI